MGKNVCELCGTMYPETEMNCPVCGCSRDFSLEDLNDEAILGSSETEAAAAGAKKKNKEIFDFDEVNQEKKPVRAMDDDDFDEEEEDEEEPRTNVFLVVILIILIVLLLLTAGFFFVRYFLPNMMDEPVQTEPVVTEAVIETEPVETTESGIPCTNLVVPGGKIELGENGMWLMNVQVYPEDTTDELTFTSEDEAIVTVSEDGTVKAVGEGETVIHVACGDMQIKCNVTVDYSLTEETEPAETVAETVAEETEETTEATEAATIAPDAVLKLKKDDITISFNRASVQLELEGDIDPAQLDWFTMDSTVAICHDGLVTAIGSGLTRIYGEYNGQQVMCVVRCIF